jgi:hypothetical protein
MRQNPGVSESIIIAPADIPIISGALRYSAEIIAVHEERYLAIESQLTDNTNPSEEYVLFNPDSLYVLGALAMKADECSSKDNQEQELINGYVESMKIQARKPRVSLTRSSKQIPQNLG